MESFNFWRGITSALLLIGFWAVPAYADTATDLNHWLGIYQKRYSVEYDGVTGEMYWYYSLAGDCDQNGVVTISDLTRLSTFLGTKVTDQSSPAAAADCDRNGEVNISDLSALGAHLGKKLNGYQVNWAQDFAPEYPFDPAKDAGAAETTVAFSQAAGNPLTDHLRFNVPAGAHLGWWFWLQEDLEDGRGAISKLGAKIYANGSLTTYDPHWGLNYDPDTMKVSFFHTVRGDHDQNASVNLSDITPLAANLAKTGPWPISDPRFAYDSFRDNQIGLADMMILRIFLHGGLTDDPTNPGPSGFTLFGTSAAASPSEYPIGSEQELGHVAPYYNPSLPQPARVGYSIQLTPQQAVSGTKLWIRPVDDQGELGSRSEIITIP